MLTFGSLFAGIGGIDCGLEWAGMKCTWQVEIDKFCLKVLNKHWPNVSKYEDIKDCYGDVFLDNDVKTWYYPSNGFYYNKEENIMAGQLKKMTKDQVEECIKMYNAGLSLEPIANYFNVSRQAMWDLLRRRITLRSQKRFGEDNNFYRGGINANDPAQNLLEKAIQKGIIKRKKHCELCGDSGKFKDGRTKIQAHHDDYNKPLDIRWLCQKCHHDWHKNNNAINKKERKGLATVDVICGGFP